VSAIEKRRPAVVTVAVVLMYLGGIAQIALGIVTVFLRYTAEAASEGIVLAVSLFGAAMILFGLFVIALASGVARGSRASRLGATTVLLLAFVLAAVDFLVAADGDWSGAAIQSVVSAAVILPLWTGAGRRYFAAR
jgi:heme A synthase